MADLKGYTDAKFNQIGLPQPYSLKPYNLAQGGNFNGAPVDRSANPDAKRFVMTVSDGTNGQLDADDGSEVTNYKHHDQSSWSKLQDELSSGLSRQLDRRGAVEARADLSSDTGLAFARAIVNEKIRIGLRRHRTRLANDAAYAANYNAGWNTYHQSHPNAKQSTYDQSMAYHLSDDQLKFVATEPAYEPDNKQSPFGIDDEHRQLHDQLLGYANEIKVSSTSLADRDNPNFRTKYQEDQYNGADTTLMVGQNPVSKSLAQSYFGDDYVTKSLDEFGFKPPYQLNMEEATQDRLENRAPNMYYSPSKQQYPYQIDPTLGTTPTQYYWRRDAVNDNSPVSVDELVNALSSSLVNSNHQKALRSALLANQGSNMTVEQDVINLRDLDGSKPEKIQIVATKDNQGNYHYMSPSDVQTSLTLISVLKDAHVNYDVIPNTKDHTVDLKLNDNSGSKIRLIDPQHPYLVGTIQMRDGMVWEPSLGRLTYHTAENQKDVDGYDTNAVFNEYDVNGHPNSPYRDSDHNSKSTSFMFPYHELETYTQTGNQSRKNALLSREATIERNARKYAALDQASKNRIAVLGVANVIGLSKQSLPPYLMYYAKDDAGNTIMENGRPKLNPNGCVFDDAQTEVQTIGGTRNGYRRRINAGENIEGEIQSLNVIRYDVKDKTVTDPETGSQVSQPDYSLVTDTDQTDASKVTLDYSNVFQGNDRSFNREVNRNPVVDPYKITEPDLMINRAYQNARVRYLVLLTGADQATSSSVTQQAQRDFRKILAAQEPVPEITADGQDVELITPKEPLDIESQDIVKNYFRDGLMQATFDDQYVNDEVLRDNLQKVSDSVNEIEDPKQRETLRARRVQAYKGLVQQMNDTFGTAPVVNGLDFTKHDDLSPNSYRLAYANRLKYLSDGNDKLAQYNDDAKNLQAIFVKYIGENPKYADANDYTKQKASEILSFERQRALLDEIPHDTASEKGQMYRQDHAVALSAFDQAQARLLKQNSLDQRLNVTQVIANTSEGENSVEYKNKMAKAAGRSRYASNLVGDTDQASLQVQERAVDYDPKTARSITDLLAEDAKPDSLNHRLHDYLDHVRGFRYVDENGQRVSDQHRNDANVTTEKVEPQVHFSWKASTDPSDPTQNPYPGAFAAKGTRGDDYHPEDIHLLNDVSPNQFLADRLLTVKKALQKNGAVNVKDDDILVDAHGMVHYDAAVALYAPADNAYQNTNSLYLTYDQYVAGYNHFDENGNRKPLYGWMDGIVNRNGYAVSEVDDKVRTGDPTLVDPNAETRSLQKISGNFGQIFAPDYDGLLTTNYYRFDGMDPKAGQKTYVPSRVAWFWNPKQDAKGNWDRDALAREHKTGLDHYSRLMTQGLSQVLDRNLDQAVTKSLSTRDLGDISRPNDSTILNSTYRKETAKDAINESLLIDKPSFDRQVRIDDMQRRLKFDDAIGTDTNTTAEINKMSNVSKMANSVMQQHDYEPSPYENFVNALAPDDPERTEKINQWMAANSMSIVLQQHSPFDAYGSTNIAELGHRHAAPFVGDANTGQSKANGGVQFLVDGTEVLPSGRVVPALVRYQTTVRDEAGEIKHQKGDPVLDKDGRYIALEQGTPVDNTEYNNMAPRNAADRESVAKDQFEKGYHRISDASIATMSLGGFTMEDAIVISEDFANKYRVPATDDNNNQIRYDQDEYDDNSGEILHHKGDLKLRPLLPGDKISDNGGNKATVSVIIPNLPADPKAQQAYYAKMDDRHLLDVASLFNQQKAAGHPIDAITGPMSQISRNNGATTSTYISNHDMRFAVQEKTADGYQDRLDENGQPELLTAEQALSQSVDTMFSVYRNDGTGAYKPDLKLDDDNFAHPTIITRDGEMDQADPQFGVKQYDEESKPMEFSRKVKNENGEYVDQVTTDADGNAVPTIVHTGATLNRGDLTVTDQLVDHKVTTHDQPDGSKGRKLSFLVNTSDNTKGANALANFHFQNGDELRKFRAGLLVMGTDIDKQTNVHAMDADRYDQLAKETSEVKYGLDPKDKEHISDVVMYSLRDRKNIDDVEANHTDRKFIQRDDRFNAIVFGTRGYGLTGKTKPGKNQLPNDRFDGYRTVTYRNPDNNGMEQRLDLSANSKSFISNMVRGLNRSAAITSNSDDASADRFDAGGDFLNKLPDGGVLRLPEGLSVKDYNGNDTNSLFILPERMRVNNLSTDGQPMVSDMNLKYQQLGTQLAKYQTIFDMGKQFGMFKDDKEKQVFSKALASNLGIQGYVTAINKEADRTTLGANQPKNGMFKNDVLGGYGGDHSVTSQLSNDPSIPLNVIEISPRIAKALGFEKDDPNSSSSYAHMKGHQKDGWDHVHVHRDPVWREQGSLGFKVKINDDTQSVMVNPAMVSLMDGDFDGDNVGLTAMPGAELQHALKNEASVDRWMMDNNGNNSLLNMDEDVSDNAIRTNNLYQVHGVDQPGHINDEVFQIKAFEQMNPAVLSASDKKMLDVNGHVKPEFVTVDEQSGAITGWNHENKDLSIENTTDFIGKMTDSEIKYRYDRGYAKQAVSQFIKASDQKDSSLDRDRITVTLPSSNQNGDQSVTPHKIEGNFHDPQFRSKLVYNMDPQAIDRTQVPRDEQTNLYQISDDDLLKALIKNEAVANPNFDYDPTKVLTRLDGQNAEDSHSQIEADLNNSASGDYREARQKVDEIVQRAFGFETQREPETGEVKTSNGPVSNLGSYDDKTGDGVSYRTEMTTRKSLDRYADNGSKGSTGKVDGLIGKYNEDTKQFEGGYIHQPTHKQIAEATSMILDSKTDEVDPHYLKLAQKLSEQHRTPQRAVQRALKIKTDATGIPGSMQKMLTAVVANGSKEDLHAAASIGQAGTQKVLGIKREPIVAGYIAEMLQKPVNQALQGSLPYSRPLFALLGDEKQGQLGSDPNMVSVRSSALNYMKDPRGLSQKPQSLSKLSSQLTDPKQFNTESIIKIASNIGMTVKPLQDKDGNPQLDAQGHLQDSEQIKAFRNTISRATQPYVRYDDVKQMAKDAHTQIYVEDDKKKLLTHDGFVEVMNYLYNDKTYGMGLGVDKQNFKRIADKLTPPDENGRIHGNTPIKNIKDVIKGDDELMASFMMQLSEEGRPAITEQLNRAKQNDNPNHQTEPLFGREGSEQRNRYLGGMSDAEVDNAFDLSGRNLGRESMFEKIRRIDHDTQPFNISVDKVNTDGRRRLDALVVSPKMAEALNVKKDDKVILQTADDSKLALNVQVDENAKNGLTISKQLQERLNGDHFGLKVKNDPDTQKELTTFVDNVMDSQTNLDDYQNQEQPLREAELQDQSIERFNRDLQKMLRRQNIQRKEAVEVMVDEPVEQSSNTNELNSLDAEIAESRADLDTKVQDVQSAATHDAYDVPTPPQDGDYPLPPQNDDYPNPNDLSESRVDDRSVDGDYDPYANATPQSSVVDTNNVDQATSVSSEAPQPVSDDPYASSNADREVQSQGSDYHSASSEYDPYADAKAGNNYELETSNGQGNSVSKAQDQSKVTSSTSDQPSRIDKIFAGDDQTPTQYGSTVNMEVANKYFTKAAQTPNVAISQRTNDFYGALNQDASLYSHENLNRTLKSLNQDYKAATGKSLFNNNDSEKFTEEAFLGRMNQSPQYANDIKTIVNKKNLINQFNANPNDVSTKTKALIKAMNAYDKQNTKSNPFENNGPDDNHHKGPDGPDI